MTTKVTFEIEVTGEASPDEIKEYIEFLLGCGSCSMDNLLIFDEPEAEIKCFNVCVE